jgi:hypothetical protein
VTRQAPRYDHRVIERLYEIDDRSVPMAETCRRLGAFAESLGLIRPSYVHVRRLIVEYRRQRDAVVAILEDVVVRVLTGRYVDGYDTLERVRQALRPVTRVRAARSRGQRAPPPRSARA